MSHEMLKLCAWTIEEARAAGAKDCKVAVSRSRNVALTYRQRKPETVKEATSQSLMFQVYADDRYSAQGTADLRRDSLREFIAEAVAATRLLARDPFRSLPPPEYYARPAPLDLKINDPSHHEWTAEARHCMARAIEGSCLAAGGDKVVSVTAQVNDQFSESALVTSNGFEGLTAATSYQAIAEMTARDEGDRRPAGYYYASARNRQALPEAEQVGRLAATRTLALLGAKKAPTETLPIIVENQSVGRLLSGFVSALSGAAVEQKRSFLGEKRGQKVGSPTLTLIDDPLWIAGMGSRPYDSDGFASQCRTIVEEGVLKEF